MHKHEVQEGSSLYYSLLFADKTQRENILHYRAIYKKLKTLHPAAIEWWRNEIQKTPDLISVFDAFAKDAETHIYEDDSHLEAFYKNTAGAFERILGKYYGVTDSPTLHHLEKLGIFIEKVNHLRDFAKHLTKNKIYISGQQLLKYRLNLYELSRQQLTPDIQRLFEDNVAHTLTYYTTNKNKFIRPTHILANIQKALLTEIQRSHFPVLTHHISLTPLRKWWIAIRS
ncbi:MAG: squalene/phytoene synthase family protein [Gammaproteobacteria bacterium]|nr:squalene/phytoene synthase family protein [Gammaproteobacteria bacterium]